MLKRNTFRKTKIFLLAAVVIYTILGFVILPLVLKPQIIEIVQKETTAKISIEHIYFNPFTFGLSVLGVELKGIDEKHLLSLKSLSIDLEPSSLSRSAIHVKEFILEKPEISLVYNKDKSINLTSILKPSTNKDDNATSTFHMPRVILDKVAIVNGNVDYQDFTKKSDFSFFFHDIGLSLGNIDTNDFNTSEAKLRFYSSLGDGGFVDFRSDIRGFKPFKVDGRLNFEASKLYTPWKYIKDSLKLEVADGKIFFRGAYDFNLDDINATTIKNVYLHVDNLRIKPKVSNKDVLTLEKFCLDNVKIEPFKKEIHVQKIGLLSLDVKAKRDANGQIDWMQYTQEIEKSDVKKEQNISTPWSVLVDDISLLNMRADFADSGVQPNVDTKIDDLYVYMQNLTLAGEKPFSYQMEMRLNKDAMCSSKGSVQHKVLDVNSYLKCNTIDIVHYKPYIDEMAKKELKLYDLKLESLLAGFDANVSVKSQKSGIFAAVKGANLNLDTFALSKESTTEKVADFSSLNLNGIAFNTKDRHVDIKKTTLNKLNVNTKRYKNKKLNLEDLVVPKETEATKNENAQEYTLLLGHVEVVDSALNFDDKALTRGAKSKIDKIYLNAYNVDSNKESWLKYNLSLRVNSRGYLKSEGSLSHTPLKQKGTLTLQKISLKGLNPYLKEKAFINIDDGFLSMKMKTKYEESRRKADLRVDGSLNLEELFVSDSRDKSLVLSLSDVKLNSLTYEMFPNRLFIDEVNVDSFYLNALVDENKKMNLSSLMKPTKEKKVSKTTKEEKFPIKITKVNVALGSANFSDLSLPIKFKTNIHDVNGVIYNISNTTQEPSHVDVTGEVDRYGSTTLKGSIDAGNPKVFTDLNFNFRNLDLEAMSGYSASFAGYKINNGKLFLGLEYSIQNSELLGKNNIIVKNIELGDEIKDANGSSLPLGLVIALLEDGDKVINIDMPVNGNVDTPDFKYGALVWKTFGNLIFKAIASPFSILGSMMGVDGDKLGYAEFEGGSANILPPEQEKLDNIAKLLIKRPKILLAIGGKYEKTIDKIALQKNKLSNIVVQKSGVKNKENHINAMNIDLLEDIYSELRDDDKADEIRDELKKKYRGEELDRAYLNALYEECVRIQVVTEDEIKNLAQKRASVIKSYLTDKAATDASRVRILDIGEVQSSSEKLVKTKLQIEVE
jgi:uncharacterized protein involved in outer membrane biogenesis